MIFEKLVTHNLYGDISQVEYNDFLEWFAELLLSDHYFTLNITLI